MARELEPELRQLVEICGPSDWAEPTTMRLALSSLLTDGRRSRWRMRRRWLPRFGRLSALEQLMLVDAHLNRRCLPQIWLFRAGVVDACAEQPVQLPSWPMPWWPLNGVMAETGDTVLHLALLAQPWVVKQLLDWGADPRVANASGQTPLHLAAARALPNVVSVLLLHGARCAARNHDGYTPLQIALACHDYYAAMMLLGAGAASADVGCHLDALRRFAHLVGETRVTAILDAEALERALPEPGALRPASVRRRL
jgi:hypothetical protein